MDKSELISALQQRSESALDQLKLHYGPLIRYVISPILEDPRDREECFSDVLLRVWERIDQFHPETGSWTNWVSAIARNAAIDRVRKRKPDYSELSDAIPAPDADPEQTLLRKERQQMLRRALSVLDTYEQALFYKKYYYRQSTAQIAAANGTTERAIEGKLYRIKKKLRKTLGGEIYER